MLLIKLDIYGIIVPWSDRILYLMHINNYALCKLRFAISVSGY